MLGTVLYERKPVSVIRTENPLQALVWATVIAGTTKLLATLLLFGTLQHNSPVQVLQFISSGLMGMPAFNGGMLAAALGVVLHFALLFSLTWGLYLLYPLVSTAGRFRRRTGLVYGIVIWAFINFIVLPISNAPQPSFPILFHVLSATGDMLLAGIPMALIIGRYYATREEKIESARALFDPSSIYY